MAKLRHLGIRTRRHGKVSVVYVASFDMKVIPRAKKKAEPFSLGGYFNLASSPTRIKTRPMGVTTSASRSKAARPSSRR